MAVQAGGHSCSIAGSLKLRAALRNAAISLMAASPWIPCALHVFAFKGTQLTWVIGRGTKRGMAAVVFDPMSSTHNESRSAACPLSGVQGVFCPVN